MQTDDAIRTSEEELGFAVASYGEETTVAFREAVQQAKARLAEAFALQQKLDDEIPDTDDERRGWYGQIIELTGQAGAVLDEQAKAFDELRALERNAPREIDRLGAAADAAEQHLPKSTALLQQLGAQYAPTALAPVADNPDQARMRLDFGRASLEEARAELAAGDVSAAAVGIRAAEEAIDQASMLAQAVERQRDELSGAERTIADGLAALAADIAASRALPPDPELQAAAAAAEASAAEIRSAATASGRDPLALTARLEEIREHLGAILAREQDEHAAAERARSMLQQTLASARGQVQSAEDFIVSRRGAVGAEARTRLAEAGRLVVLAESTPDPAAALQTAQRASALAGQAMQLAQHDVGGFAAQQDPLGGLFGGGASGRSSGGSDVLGAVLGGILINSALGGGGSRRSGGTRSGGGGGFRPGSFGGSATRSRRGGGGRF